MTREKIELDDIIGRNLRALRKIRGFKQSDIARMIGVTFQQVQKYETGKNRITASKLKKISDFLEVEIDAFFAESVNELQPFIDNLSELSEKHHITS